MPVTVKCLYCGGDFSVDPYRVRNGTARYCSNACRQRGRRLEPFSEEWAARFWANVDKSGDCWIWTRATDGHGYGSVSLAHGRAHSEKAHRVSWILANGPIPKGVEVCHNCPGGDNPACVRPDHLFLGTHRENMLDAAAKGIMHPGSANGMAKITEDAARAIRTRYAAGGVLQRELAAEYGINPATVSEICSGAIWKHLA